MTGTLILDWIRQSPLFNTANNEYSSTTVTDASNNVIVAFTSDTAGTAPNNGIVVKFDPVGTLLWKNTDISGIAAQVSITYSMSSDVIYVTYVDADTGDIHITKLSSSGTTIWDSVPTGIQTGPGSRGFPSISVDVSDNIFIAYEAGSPVNIYVAHISSITGQDIWIDYDLSMNIPTRNCLRPSISMIDTQYAYICFYYIGPAGTLRDVVAAKYDVTAPLTNKLVWKVQGLTIDTSGNDLFPNMTHDSMDNLYIAYRYGNNPTYAINTFKIDQAGNVIWVNKNTATSTKIEPSITITKNNELFVFYIDNSKLMVQALDPTTGVSLWTDVRADLNPVLGSMLVGENAYICRNCTADSDGAVIVTYSISGDAVAGGTDSGLYDLVVAKFNTPYSGRGTFPVLTGNGMSYVTIGRVNVYTGDAIAALRTHVDLPPTTTTSFSPLTTGRLLRNLGRSHIVTGLYGNYIYRFTEVQLINGPSTEGDDGGSCGWICTWAASGTPPPAGLIT